MQKSVNEISKSLALSKAIFMFLGILNLFQTFAWLMISSERYSEKYIMGSSFQDWPPALVTTTFCLGWLISWKILERFKIVKYKSEFFITLSVWIIPIIIFGIYSAMIWNDFMLRDLGSICLFGYMSGFSLRSSFFDVITVQNIRAIFPQAGR